MAVLAQATDWGAVIDAVGGLVAWVLIVAVLCGAINRSAK